VFGSIKLIAADSYADWARDGVSACGGWNASSFDAWEEFGPFFWSETSVWVKIVIDLAVLLP
jgi:hypothetical protein